MKRKWLIAVCIFAIWPVSCAKRQAAARIVFVSAIPPPASAPSAKAADALIVASRAGAGHQAEPLVRSDMERWLADLARRFSE